MSGSSVPEASKFVSIEDASAEKLRIANLNEAKMWRHNGPYATAADVVHIANVQPAQAAGEFLVFNEPTGGFWAAFYY
jgi:hypothetical protein